MCSLPQVAGSHLLIPPPFLKAFKGNALIAYLCPFPLFPLSSSRNKLAADSCTSDSWIYLWHGTVMQGARMSVRMSSVCAVWATEEGCMVGGKVGREKQRGNVLWCQPWLELQHTLHLPTFPYSFVYVSFSGLHPLSASPFHSLLLTQNCFIWHRLLMSAIEAFLSVLPSSTHLSLHSFTWLSPVCLLIWPPLLPDDFLSPISTLLTSAHCGFPSCPHLTLFPSLPPFLFTTLPFPLWTWLGSAYLRVKCPTLLLSPHTHTLFFAPPILFQLFIYIGRNGGRAVWMDWWMTWEAMGEGIWEFDGCFCQSGY